MSSDQLMRSARVLAAWPPNGRPGWRKQPDGTTRWSDPSPVPAPRAEPSREVGVVYDQRVRWGRFVGFEADDRGLLARVEFHDEPGEDPTDVVSIARIVGLNGRPIEGAPTPTAVLEPAQDDLARMRDGIERIADRIDDRENGLPWAARELRALAKAVR